MKMVCIDNESVDLILGGVYDVTIIIESMTACIIDNYFYNMSRFIPFSDYRDRKIGDLLDGN